MRLIKCATLCLAVTSLVGCSAVHHDAVAHEHHEEHPRAVITQTEPKPIAEMVKGKEGVIRLTITDDAYNLQRLHAKLGAPVRIYVRNEGARPHTLLIPRFGIVTSPMAPGADNFIEFTAGARGGWEVFSGAPGQPEPGLTATLQVE